MSYVNTPQPGRYTTQLLADMRDRPELRGVAAIAVVLLITSVAGLTQAARSRAAAAPATPLPIILVATARPALPTATPEPPQVRELEDGTILGFDPARGWYVVKDAPASAGQPAAVDAPPTAEPAYQASYQQPAPVVEPEPEAAPQEDVPTPELGSADWYNPQTLPTALPAFVAECERPEARGSIFCGGSGKNMAIDFSTVGNAPQDVNGDDAARWCAAAEAAGRAACVQP